MPSSGLKFSEISPTFDPWRRPGLLQNLTEHISEVDMSGRAGIEVCRIARSTVRGQEPALVLRVRLSYFSVLAVTHRVLI